MFNRCKDHLIGWKIAAQARVSFQMLIDGASLPQQEVSA
jgi:hypothetical protein